MAVLKNKTDRKNYLVVSKIFLQDENLNLTERGLLATLHSLPDEWDFTIRGMAKILPDGEYRIKGALNGLVNKGYLIKNQEKTKGGKFGGNVIEINEKPNMKKSAESKPLREKPSADKPHTEETPTELPLSDKKTQYIINQYSNDQYNNQSISPEDSHQKLSLSKTKTEEERNRVLIAENIHLDWLLAKASEQDPAEQTMVQEIYDVICDMVNYPRDTVEIKGTSYPWETVKAQFLKLRHCHVAAVLNRVLDARLGIKNMSAYLVSMLYHESLTGTIKEQADLHDDYLRYLRGKPY